MEEGEGGKVRGIICVVLIVDSDLVVSSFVYGRHFS